MLFSVIDNQATNRSATMTQIQSEAELIQLFQDTKALLDPYAAHFSVRIDRPHRYELWSEKPIEIADSKRKEVFFASLILQSNYVGFYFMPVYADQNLAQVFSRALLATKRGKSCFHLKQSDPSLLEGMKEALRIGFKLYQDRNWSEKS